MTAFMINDDNLIINAIEIDSIPEGDRNIAKYIEGLWIGDHYPTLESLYTELKSLQSASYKEDLDSSIGAAIDQI